VGTTEQVAKWIACLRPDLKVPSPEEEDQDVYIAHCPERVLPGRVIDEIVTNDRIIGGLTPGCAEKAVQLYSIFLKGACHVTNARTAEMVKLTENASRDVSIAFANELSVICDTIDIDVWELIDLANKHPRVNILQPGPGVGGHCIAVDPWFIASKSPETSKIIQTARRVNDDKPGWVLKKIQALVEEFGLKSGGRLPMIACYGLTFKPNIDDLRESPSLQIAQKLFENYGECVVCVEPNISNEKISGIKNMTLEAAYSAADIHLLLVDHVEFNQSRPKNGILFDTRGCWRSQQAGEREI
jgi:UDP-N-acetyl-D-mannosaminuronic acid dehydrogenase